jgi:hypothetical protein
MIIFYPGADLESCPPVTVALSCQEYESYLTFEGPVYERYRHLCWSEGAVRVKDEADRERWVEARNRWLDADELLHLRDMWGNLKTTFAQRQECERIMEEAEREMEALEIREEIAGTTGSLSSAWGRS